MGALLIAWSIRVALVLFFVTIALRIWYGPQSRRTLLASLWTVGFVFFLMHVLAAYHFQYQWSHIAAVMETAQQTKEQIGVEFGGGIYFNFLFLICWAVAVYESWSGDKNAQNNVQDNVQDNFRGKTRWGYLCGVLFMLFIAFNGTVVFKSGWIRVQRSYRV